MEEYTPTNFDILHRRESGKKIYWTAAAQRPGWASGEAPSNSSLRTSGWERHEISRLAMVPIASSHISITPKPLRWALSEQTNFPMPSNVLARACGYLVKDRLLLYYVDRASSGSKGPVS